MCWLYCWLFFSYDGFYCVGRGVVGKLDFKVKGVWRIVKGVVLYCSFFGVEWLYGGSGVGFVVVFVVGKCDIVVVFW